MASYDKDGKACELIDYTALNKSLHRCMLTDEDTYTDEKDPIFVPNEKHKAEENSEEDRPLRSKNTGTEKNNIFKIVK
jgi:hypothetical protein